MYIILVNMFQEITVEFFFVCVEKGGNSEGLKSLYVL